MSEIYSDFLAEDNLEQCRHGFTTQANESFNNSIASYAPKNKVYGTSMSLSNRVSIAIGVKNEGKKQYWQKVYSKMSMTLPLRLSVFLENTNNRSLKKKEKEATPSFKKKRAIFKNEQIRVEAEKTKRGMEKEMNYSAGIGLAPATATTATTDTTTANTTVRNSTQPICPLPGCGIRGHKTNRSSKCRWYGMFKGVQSKNLPEFIELHLQQKENNENRVPKNFEENLSFENHREFLCRNSTAEKKSFLRLIMTDFV